MILKVTNATDKDTLLLSKILEIAASDEIPSDLPNFQVALGPSNKPYPNYTARAKLLMNDPKRRLSKNCKLELLPGNKFRVRETYAPVGVIMSRRLS
jgi:hypothetical protein